MTNEPIEDVYFNWLYSKVASVDNPSPSLNYYTLLQEMHHTEFVWQLQGDDNRAQDGIDIRKEFLMEARLEREPEWMNVGCSVLEMLIAFSRRAAFQTEDVSPREWFWIFLENLGLSALSDNKHGIIPIAKQTLDDFVWRTYAPDGSGGLFPLNYAEVDQRLVEVWYQFCEYLIEHNQA